MKFYISEKLGSLYWIGEDQNFFVAPLLRDDGIIDLDEDGGVVDYDNLVGETVHDTPILLNDELKRIETILRT